MNRIWTSEEKACQKIADILSDLRLDSHQIGTYLGESQPVEILNRIVTMVDGMYESREQFRRRLGETPSEVPIMDLIDEELPLGEAPTSFIVRCNILAELWVNYSNTEEFEVFFTYNDIGLPLAFMVSQELVGVTEKAKDILDETWEALLEKEGIKDTGFTNLADVFSASV